MRLKGKLVTWNSGKAFGFIRLFEHTQNKDIFVHKSEIKGLRRQPKVGDIVTFTLGNDKKGRSRALDAVILSAKKKKQNNNFKEYNLFFASAFTIFLIVSFWVGKLPLELVLCYLIVSLVSFLMYYFDKRASLSGRERTPENTLLLLGLIGGWPGAIAAQQIFRHKSSKKSFRNVFWTMVVLNIMCLILIAYLL